MTGLRKLQPSDIFAIKDDLVEANPFWQNVTHEHAENIVNAGIAYTYVKDGEIVGICGAFKDAEYWSLWALYSAKFSMITRSRAVIAFGKKFREQLTGVGRFSVPSNLCNGAKYAKFIGGKLLRTEPSLLFDGITNSIYEVV